MWGFIFTNTLAAVGTLYGWLNPFVGLMIYYAFAILRPEFLWFWSFGGGSNRYSLMIGISTLIGWVAAGFGDWSRVRPVLIPILGLALYLASGAIAAIRCDINPAVAWDALSVQAKIGLMALVTLTLVRTPRQINILAWVIVASMGYLAYTLNQHYRSNPMFLLNRGFGGIDNNGVAMMMVTGVAPAFFLGIHDRRWWAKLLYAVAVLCMAHVVLFSFSRGGQLGLCIVGLMIFAVVLYGLPHKMLTLLVAAIFVAIVLRLAGVEVRERFWTIFADPEQRDVSAESRFVTWKAAWECIKDNPMGVGPRNFNRISDRYGLPNNKSVHNLFLQTGADYGVGGMVGLGVFYLGSAWLTFRMTLTRTARRLVWPRYYGHMVCISLAGFVVCSQFIGMEAVEIAYIVSILGLCAVSYVRTQQAAEPSEDLAVLPELEHVHPGSDDGLAAA